MGWNSWDAYGLTLDEGQFKANARIVAGLQRWGWRYVVIDEGWYMGDPLGETLQSRDYRLDGHGLLTPAREHFPSAADGQGFRRLAAWTHARGLKFGIHIVRGIPKAAVEANLPIAARGSMPPMPPTAKPPAPGTTATSASGTMPPDRLGTTPC